MRSAWSVASERIIIPRLDSLTDQSGIRGKADQVYLGGNLLENVNIWILIGQSRGLVAVRNSQQGRRQ